MSQKEKLLAKIKNNIKDVKFKDLCKLLDHDGWIVSTKNSSHFTYKKDGVGRVTIVRKGDGKVKPIYVSMVLDFMGGA